MIKYINQSMLNMAAKCMKQVEYRYIKGIIVPPSAAAHRGTAVHKAAQKDSEAIRSSQTHLSISDMQDIASSAFQESLEKNGVYFSNEEAPNSNEVLSKSKDEALKAAVVYAEHISPKIVSPVSIEYEAVIDLETLSYQLGGTIDLIHLVNEKHKISDLKTTAKKPDQGVATSSIQAPFYTLLAEHALGIKTDFDYNYLVIQKTKQEAVNIPAIITLQSHANVLNRAHVLESYLKTGVFMPADPSSWWCSESWCGFWGMCPYGEKQTIQISTN